jgi:low temperature requirement protein LtrA
MTRRRRRDRRIHRLTIERRERETVKPLELFFDLVFVLGFTQCTAFMVAEPTWEGIGRACSCSPCSGGPGSGLRG